MSQPTTMQPDDPGTSEHSRGPAGSPGRQLRAIREERGIDIERIAAQLHLNRGVVEALEQDQFERLPSPVFVAGYLRNYARLLGADSKPIVDAYHALQPDRSAPLIPPQGGLSGHAPSRIGVPWSWIIGFVLVIVAGGLAGLWWQSRGPAGEMSTLEPSEQTSTAEAPDDSATLTEGTSEDSPPADSRASASVPPDAIPLRRAETSASTEDSAQSGSAPSDESETIPAASLPTVTPKEPETEPEAEPVEQAPPSRDVVLMFSGTSWVDVRDAGGEVVLNGEMRDGDRRVLTGEPPFKLVIGNAAATQLTIGGKPFDLEGRARGNVARFTLDPNETE